MAIVVITSFAPREFKGAIYLQHLLSSDDINVDHIVFVRRRKTPLAARLRTIQKSQSLLSIIKNNVLGMNEWPSWRELILSFLDHNYCMVSAFLVRWSPNFWRVNYDFAQRRYLRLRLAKKHAVAKGIPVTEVIDLDSAETLQLISDLKPTFIVLAGTGVLPCAIINCAVKAVLNCHSSILPGYRGTDSEFFALEDGRIDLLGHTVHAVTSVIDGGAIYHTRKINYTAGYDNHLSLREKNIREGAKSIAHVLRNFDEIDPEVNDVTASVYRSKHSFLRRYRLLAKLSGR